MATKRLRVSVARHARNLVGEKVSISGWIRTIRKQGKITFLEVNDGSSLNNMQIVAGFDIGNNDDGGGESRPQSNGIWAHGPLSRGLGPIFQISR